MDKDRKSDTKLQDSCLFHEIQHFNSNSVLKKIDGYIHTDNQIQRYNSAVADPGGGGGGLLPPQL